MPVTFNGNTTSFTGKGTINPQKLVITRKNELDGANYAMALAIEQWANNLQTAGAFTVFSQTYSVSGVLQVPSGATGYLPPFFMPVAAEPVALYGVIAEVRAGSCVVNIEHNGAVIATGLAIGVGPTEYPVVASVANNDSFQVVITSVSSADGLSCSFYFAA